MYDRVTLPVTKNREHMFPTAGVMVFTSISGTVNTGPTREGGECRRTT